MKLGLFLFLLIFPLSQIVAQREHCIVSAESHQLNSTFLKEERTFWVSLPFQYDTAQQYPVLYVLDAEWRFSMVHSIIFDLGANHKIPPHIVVGIPHVDWKHKRGMDLTFSESRMEYDGSKVDSTVYNSTNSGSGEPFFNYLTQELIPSINQRYATNQEHILTGHSYGGYFGSYLLSKKHPFTAFQIYDPSIWFSDGEVIKRLKQQGIQQNGLNVFISYQPEPDFHAQKIEAFIEYLSTQKKLQLGVKKYTNETHNSLFLPSFLEGIRFLYRDYESSKAAH